MSEERKFNSLQFNLALVSAMVAVFTAIITAWHNINVEERKYKSELQLQKAKLASELVLKVIDKGELESAKRNFDFLLSSGFIDDPDGKIADAINNYPLALPRPNRDTGGRSTDIVGHIEEVVTLNGTDMRVSTSVLKTEDSSWSYLFSIKNVGKKPITLCVPEIGLRGVVEPSKYLKQEQEVDAFPSRKGLYIFSGENSASVKSFTGDDNFRFEFSWCNQ